MIKKIWFVNERELVVENIFNFCNLHLNLVPVLLLFSAPTVAAVYQCWVHAQTAEGKYKLRRTERVNDT